MLFGLSNILKCETGEGGQEFIHFLLRKADKPTVNLPATNVARSASVWRDEALLHRRGVARTFHQEHVEVRGHRLSTQLPHHQSDLASVVSGMVHHMLH